MSDEADPVTYGGIDAKRYGFTQKELDKSRAKKAKASLEWNKKNSIYQNYFMGYMDTPHPEDKKEEENDKKREAVVDLTVDDDQDKKKRQRKK